ncbi:Arc family DNA-binding protein [Rahnella woolbedingensis]|uniref:Arc family DNA-binding protein n=1 Tax=Rahnella woolbedingensis TaxID=1510574 RepID=A0A419NF14_9GAMM|nr:Arc family DNA-binding protein [Rahnella woolbedingensis]RJT47248.1 Arc family DNA-binding protein [Rahnella woolbedingensis]
MSKFPSQEMDRFNVRLPAGMRESIAERAKANGRSMNSELILIIDEALKNPFTRAPDESKLMKAYSDLACNRPSNEDEMAEWEEKMNTLLFNLFENMTEQTNMYQLLKSLSYQVKEDLKKKKNKKAT